MDTAPFVLDVGIPAVKALPAEGDLIIEGFAADFETDRQGEQFLPGAFDEACRKATLDHIPLLDEHDNNRQLGVVEKLEVREKGLWARARIAEPTMDWAKDSVLKIKRGMKKGLSVRGLIKVDKGKIGHIDLAEISVTPVPVQPGALLKVASKSLAFAAGDPQDLAWAASGDPTAAALDAYFEGQFKNVDEAFAEVSRLIGEYRRAQG